MRQTAKQRTQDKDQKAGNINPFAAEQVAEPAQGQDQTDNAEVVDQQNPLNERQVAVKNMGERGQSDLNRAMVDRHDGETEGHLIKHQPGMASLLVADIRIGHELKIKKGGGPVPAAPSSERLFPENNYDRLPRSDALSSRLSSALARLRRTSFLLFKIFPGGGSSLRTFARPMGIFFADGLNARSFARKSRRSPAADHG